MTDLHPAQQALKAERHWRGAICRVPPQAAAIKIVMRSLIAVVHLMYSQEVKSMRFWAGIIWQAADLLSFRLVRCL